MESVLGIYNGCPSAMIAGVEPRILGQRLLRSMP